ncbi:Endonuclease 4 [Vitis vinifera]|uniref:Aspergillus nuclease S1 n=1 Tax=Vitis vinifera TaxID=29760 RepID=A0A438JHY5_VITVI|nr:Endonuclease 4 [Vitis vinifera]
MYFTNHLPNSKPLHVGFTGDEGGNTIIVRWYRRRLICIITQVILSADKVQYDSIKLVLFQIWDDMIIDSALKTYYNSDIAIMIQAIQRNITGDWSFDISSWKNCASDDTACPNL